MVSKRFGNCLVDRTSPYREFSAECFRIPRKDRCRIWRITRSNIFNLLALSHKVIGYEQVTNICPKQICPEVFEEDDFLTRERVLLEDSVIIYLHRLLPRKYRTLLPSIEGRWSNFLYKKPPSAPKKKSHKGLILKENRGKTNVLLLFGIIYKPSAGKLQP